MAIKIDPVVEIVILIFMGGWAISALVRGYFSYKIKQQQKAYDEKVKERLAQLSAQIHEQSQNVQESLDIVNKEYADLVKDVAERSPQGAMGDDDSMMTAPPGEEATTGHENTE